ncbi:MAG: cell division protein FtsH, partial [Brevibacterium sp.]|nr:cell division protein FtsH [Brevibacterium sp.]
MVLPSEDKYSTTRNELLDQLAYAMGGRVAEEVVFHDPTTGASSDIEKATDIARKMVTQYGMSDKLGMVKLGDDQGEPFAGRGYGGGDEYGDSTLSSIDREVREIIDAAHADAYWALTHNRDVLDDLAYQLLERETLDQAALAEIFTPIVKRPTRDVWLANDERPVSERGPIAPPAPLSGDRNGKDNSEVDTPDVPGAGPTSANGPHGSYNPTGPINPNDPTGPTGPSHPGDSNNSDGGRESGY